MKRDQDIIVVRRKKLREEQRLARQQAEEKAVTDALIQEKVKEEQIKTAKEIEKVNLADVFYNMDINQSPYILTFVNDSVHYAL